MSLQRTKEDEKAKQQREGQKQIVTGMQQAHQNELQASGGR
jgi:hypothetical protein